MLISIITVTLNRGPVLARAIDSVASQIGVDKEHIVIDGGSTDDTAGIVSSRARHVAHFLSEPDRGIYDAMNKGLRVARGDIIGFLHSDDRYASHITLQKVVDAITRSGSDCCYGDLLLRSAERRGVGTRYWRSREYKPGLFLKGWMPPHPTFFFRRRVYDQIGGFNDSFKISADYDFMLRALEVARLKSIYIPETLVVMAHGGASTKSLRAVLRGNWECLVSRRQNGLPARHHLLITKPASKLLQLARGAAPIPGD